MTCVLQKLQYFTIIVIMALLPLQHLVAAMAVHGQQNVQHQGPSMIAGEMKHSANNNCCTQQNRMATQCESCVFLDITVPPFIQLNVFNSSSHPPARPALVDNGPSSLYRPPRS